MQKIGLLNQISPAGLAQFDRTAYAPEQGAEGAVGIMVRSAVMHDMAFPDGLLAIARAGAGVNNIPVDRCAEQGIVVFNTPGANANGVAELAVCAIYLASRDIVGGIAWAKTLESAVAKAVEKGESWGRSAGSLPTVPCICGCRWSDATLFCRWMPHGT